MVAVAIFALAFELESWNRRNPYCQDNATRCASAERAHLWLAEGHERISALYRKHAADPRASVRYNNEQAAFFTRAARGERAESARAAERGEAFRRAARYPWVSIPPKEVDPMGFGRIDREGQPGKSGLNEGSNRDRDGPRSRDGNPRMLDGASHPGG